MNVYEIITQKIIDALKGGEIPWRKPWKGGTLGYPRNWNGVPYRGINVWMLGLTGETFKYPFWFGQKKIKDLGGSIKEGKFLNHRICTYYKITNKKKMPDGSLVDTEKKRFMLLYHKVWNLDDIQGITIPEPLQILIREHETLGEKKYDKKEECEKLINGYSGRPEITELEQRAYYRPSTDTVNMPKMGSFIGVDEYYATLFHELAHSTGHHSRLDRQGISKGYFGDEIYSNEELVAEFSATFLCGLAGIEQSVIQNSTAYIQNWIKKLQDKPQIAVQAAQTASRAVDYILGIKPKEYTNEQVESSLQEVNG
jgi:antirestriction protein ArdC